MLVQSTLRKMVEHVKVKLLSVGVKVPFFIAGGSVYSTMHGKTNFNDIDVFFYDQYGYDTVRNAFSVAEQIEFESVNAMSVKGQIFVGPYSYKLQFVKLHVGSVEEVFQTFDFNCSMCAIESNFNIIISDKNNDKITVNTKNINGLTVVRYDKYIFTKGATDPGERTLKVIINHLVDNYQNKYDTSYEHAPTVSGRELLDQCLSRSIDLEMSQYLHDCIASRALPERLHIFSDLHVLIKKSISNQCDEYKLFKMLAKINTGIFWQSHPLFGDDFEEERRIKEKYAEYFI